MIDFPAPDRGGPAGHVEDQAAAFALGALEPDEAAAVERHAAGCPRCARAIESARRTTAVLPFLAPPVSPAPDVKAALFARIAQSQASAPPATVVTPAWAAPPAPVRTPTLPASGPWVSSVDGSNRSASSAPTSRGGRARFGRVSAASTAAALLMVVGLVGAWSLGLNDRDEPASYEETLGAILGSAGTRHLEVNEHVEGPVRVSNLDVSVDTGADPRVGGRAVAQVTLADEPTPGAAYYIWPLRADGTAGDGALLKVNEAGFGTALIPLVGSPDQYTSACVGYLKQDPAVVCRPSASGD